MIVEGFAGCGDFLPGANGHGLDQVCDRGANSATTPGQPMRNLKGSANGFGFVRPNGKGLGLLHWKVHAGNDFLPQKAHHICCTLLTWSFGCFWMGNADWNEFLSDFNIVAGELGRGGSWCGGSESRHGAA